MQYKKKNLFIELMQLLLYGNPVWLNSLKNCRFLLYMRRLLLKHGNLVSSSTNKLIHYKNITVDLWHIILQITSLFTSNSEFYSINLSCYQLICYRQDKLYLWLSNSRTFIAKSIFGLASIIAQINISSAITKISYESWCLKNRHWSAL